MKKIDNSEWKLSWMALAVFIGGSIVSQFLYMPDIPHIPSILGWMIGSVLLVIGNVIYVLFKRKKNTGTEKENHNHG